MRTEVCHVTMDEPGREDFEKFLLERFPPSGKRGTSGIFYQDFGEKVKEAIKDPSATSVDKHLRFYIKKNDLSVLDLLSVGARDLLVVPVKENKENVEDNSILGQYRKVVYVEDFFKTIQDVHEKELLHAGYKKTFEKIQSLYHGIPRSVVQKPVF